MRKQTRMLAMMLTVSLACGAMASNSDIKSLSQDEQSALLAGRGMGLARPAELNGYPGPTHVLELAAQLDLNASSARRHSRHFRAHAASRAEPMARH